MRELSGHREQIVLYKDTKANCDDLAVLIELAEEENDAETFSEVEAEFKSLEQRVGEIEFQNMCKEINLNILRY